MGKKEETAEEHEREAGMVKGSEIDNVAQFELPLWLLGQCASVKEVRALLARINITNTPFQ